MQAVLVRVAFNQSEDDRVRMAAVQELLNQNSIHLDLVLIGLLVDRDPEMRLAAVEGLFIRGGALIGYAAQVCENDESAEVRKAIARASSGMELGLFYLDPPVV